MTETARPSLDLNARIKDKHGQIKRYLARAKPRKRRLINTSIVAGSLSTLLTAGPALGGKSFSGWLSNVFGFSSPSWQILCGAAAIFSLAATVALQFLKSNNLEENVAKAQICSAKLELLEIALASGQMDDKQALTELMRCVEEMAFVEGEAN